MSFSNPATETMYEAIQKEQTQKADKEEHGFGIVNIQRAVKENKKMKKYIVFGSVIVLCVLCLIGGFIIGQNSVIAEAEKNELNNIMYEDIVEDYDETEFKYIENSKVNISNDSPHTYSSGSEN